MRETHVYDHSGLEEINSNGIVTSSATSQATAVDQSVIWLHVNPHCYMLVSVYTG